MVGTRKIFTTSYSPQTDGCVDRFNDTFCRDLAKLFAHEVYWDKHVAFAVFHYNSSRNEATGISPCLSMFRVEIFEFYACLSLSLRLDEEPHDFARRLAETHT